VVNGRKEKRKKKRGRSWGKGKKGGGKWKDTRTMFVISKRQDKKKDLVTIEKNMR